ncbi:MAG: ferredoxin-like protein [Deltaproteobacteria bacterium]|nr:ferredoxin-like protein [Deltaproteobacteria bacterium]
MTKKVEEKIALNAIKNDVKSHIMLNQSICAGCKERMCIRVCPAHLYSMNEDTGEMVVEYAGCLECGTCLVACTYGSITWDYPSGEYGVQYRYG